MLSEDALKVKPKSCREAHISYNRVPCRGLLGINSTAINLILGNQRRKSPLHMALDCSVMLQQQNYPGSESKKNDV